MTDATFKEALSAVTKLLPDTHFAILLVVEIPPFGESKVGPVDIMTTAGAQQVREIIGRVWLYVLIGIGIGAGLHGFVPQDFFARYAGPDNPFAVPFAVLAGIPLYSNAAGMIPIVEALLAKGLPVGTVLALMMSITAISLPELMILRKVLKPRLIATFIAVVGVGILLIGYLFNLMNVHQFIIK